MVALWGAYQLVIIWRRTTQLRFRNDREQNQLLEQIENLLAMGDLPAIFDQCRDDVRAVPQLVAQSIEQRHLSYQKLRHTVTDAFRRDVLSDLEYRMSWVVVVIKTAPMLGLFGTVLGMMAAFAKLSSGDKVEPTQLADDISLALITTAIGLAIAIPLTIGLANVTIRIRKLEDLVSVGLTRFFDAFKPHAGK
ncbi:MAG: MotA/TolQ/ExbB proton channel family protein [Planctomycetaceae bacterium]|nr:MotA/TolQ/ExbB proton channel family protein [Planctomycetaceae bacterium]